MLPINLSSKAAILLATPLNQVEATKKIKTERYVKISLTQKNMPYLTYEFLATTTSYHFFIFSIAWK